MKIKELIETLENILKEKGNLPVHLCNIVNDEYEEEEYNIDCEIDFVGYDEYEVRIWKGDEIKWKYLSQETNIMPIFITKY